ncbi:Flp pilus assembly complex ATPase component TadA, partial [Candidatus Micrarchaeota archaeon]|nr:Flp pilus assembly complex ATPase component TadA [Candidatus Micrarchaeota archaeon]
KGIKKEIYFTLMDYCERNLIELEEEQEEYLLGLLESMIYSFGPLTSILRNDEIEEISVIGLGEMKPVRIFDRSFGWMKTNLYYCSETTVKDLVNKMARGIGRRLTLQTPKLNAVLPDGSRINAMIPPVSFSGPTLTIRKFKKKPFTPIELIENKTFSLELMAFIWMALQTDTSVLVVGNTGSGKTSSLNALFCFIPKEERIVVVEETPEIILPQKHLIKLSIAENLGIGMQELITDTLRMRPDRVIVGEIRSREEVGAFIDTLLAGQGKGSYATFHAQSAKEAIVRLEKLGVMEIDLGSIDLVLVQKRWNQINKGKGASKEMRRIVEVSEVNGGEEGIKLRELYSFNHKRNKLQQKNESEKVLEKIKNCFRMNEKEVRKELSKRKKQLKKFGREKLELKELFERMNGEGDD